MVTAILRNSATSPMVPRVMDLSRANRAGMQGSASVGTEGGNRAHRPAPKPGPDFSHVTGWIFDLDNTLYPASSDLFARIDARMRRFVASFLGVGESEAHLIQKRYYREHGTTLNGLMACHGLDPEDYLSFVHDIALDGLGPDPAMREAIERLPGRRFIFTNGCASYASRVLDRLALTSLFDDVWDIRTIRFCPKPDPTAYARVVERAKLSPASCAMFEDLSRNLVPAHALGMTTVWLRNESEWSNQGPLHPVATNEHIHHETNDLAQFLARIRIEP